jgi:hypothetical protein
MHEARPDNDPPASGLIDEKVAALADWRGATLARMSALIHEAHPGIIETWKWWGAPVWEHHGILCTGGTYKDKVKLTFAHGALLPDPAGLFNASLEGNIRRAIDIAEGVAIDGGPFKALVAAALAQNVAKAAAKPRRRG